MSATGSLRRIVSFGHRIPTVIGALIIMVATLSIGGAVGGRMGLPLVEWGVLAPAEVWHGQLWRLVTWTFFELSPIGLLFACLMLYWFGRDLVAEWGTPRFLRVYFGLSAGTAVVVCLLARVWPELMNGVFAGSVAANAGLVIAWALTFPERQIYLYFIVRLGGMVLVYVTLGITTLFALYYGAAAMAQEFAAEALILGYMYRYVVVRRWRALFARKPKRSKSTADIRVWDEKKQEFRKPKWMN